MNQPKEKNGFQILRDNAGIFTALLIIGWSGSQLKTLNDTAIKLSESLIEMKTIQGFHSFRLDKQGEKLNNIEARVDTLKVDMSRVQERLTRAR